MKLSMSLLFLCPRFIYKEGYYYFPTLLTWKSFNKEHMMKTRILLLYKTQVCLGSNEMPTLGETCTYFQSPILFFPLSLLKKTRPFPASPSTATPSITQNPSSEDKQNFCFRNSSRHSPREWGGGNTSQNQPRITSYSFLPRPAFFSPSHSYLSYKISSGPEGELSQYPFCSQHDKEKQKKPTRTLTRTWHTVHFQMDKSFCPTPPICYLNEISVLCIPPLFEIFISLVTLEIDSSLWSKEE